MFWNSKFFLPKLHSLLHVFGTYVDPPVLSDNNNN